MRPNPFSFALAATLALAAAVTVGDASLQTADAAKRDRGDGAGYVVARSHFGNGTLRAPVRRSGRGYYEVRMPGGTWISCKGDCAETLREETLDFWKEREKLSPNRSR